MKGILNRLEQAEGMRGDSVDGEFYKWPEVGGSFRFFAFTDGKMRTIETSQVIEIIERGGGKMVFRVKDGLFEVTKTG